MLVFFLLVKLFFCIFVGFSAGVGIDLPGVSKGSCLEVFKYLRASKFLCNPSFFSLRG